MKFRIGVDIDDVVSDYVRAMVLHYNKVYGTGYSYNDIKYWNLYETLVELETAEGMKAFLDSYVYHPDFENIPAVTDAVDSIKLLIEDGHEIYFITSRTSKSIDRTYKWLAKHGLPIERVFFNKDKGWLAQHLKLDFHIDDGVHNLQSVHEGSPDTALILFNRPWNAGVSLPMLHDRVSRWSEILEIIDGCNQTDA